MKYLSHLTFHILSTDFFKRLHGIPSPSYFGSFSPHRPWNRQRGCPQLPFIGPSKLQWDAAEVNQLNLLCFLVSFFLLYWSYCKLHCLYKVVTHQMYPLNTSISWYAHGCVCGGIRWYQWPIIIRCVSLIDHWMRLLFFSPEFQYQKLSLVLYCHYTTLYNVLVSFDLMKFVLKQL